MQLLSKESGFLAIAQPMGASGTSRGIRARKRQECATSVPKEPATLQSYGPSFKQSIDANALASTHHRPIPPNDTSACSLVFEGVFLITAELSGQSDDSNSRRRYSSFVSVPDGQRTSHSLALVMIPDDDCVRLEVNSHYHLRGPVLPRDSNGNTIFYPTARSVMILPERNVELGIPVLSVRVISRGRVIQCRNQ
ncbi:uncharacterized protein MELLADRAFT_102832 [Melampsora larici-populina 98AG31]|uniref:Uncharacterized protein n=1 Tax=Melampsora larici-populina (strain 98AG31 / pathotype 3-4-7) TaxID=747676 RepID=F4R9J1_MELLP|nr:uncharacterized protein MELLADRAFT_102832 [Melampsora larici-populina 98AG31]EGG11140.1 hypothetical protein MELLADRAFT_102832 [Melampsora larici-populina 98AG31]